MNGPLEPVVGTEAIVAKHPRPVQSDHPLQGVGTALGVDGVGTDLITDPDMEPGGLPSHTPTGLVGGDLLGPPEVIQDVSVVGFQPLGGPEVDLGRCSAGQLDAEEGVEHGGHLAGRQSHPGVQEGGRRLGIGTDLTSGGSQCVRSLELVASLDPTPAPVALSDVHLELSDDGSSWDFGLELVGTAGEGQLSSAVGTTRGQWCVEALVGWSRWWWSMSVCAVCVAGLASGLLGLLLGWSLSEGCSLSFGGAYGLFELAGQFCDLSFEFGDPLESVPATETHRFVHTLIVQVEATLGSGPTTR